MAFAETNPSVTSTKIAIKFDLHMFEMLNPIIGNV